MMPTVRCWLYVSNVSLSACGLDEVGEFGPRFHAALRAAAQMPYPTSVAVFPTWNCSSPVFRRMEPQTGVVRLPIGRGEPDQAHLLLARTALLSRDESLTQDG